ncbi:MULTISPECIES: hypothetical protein [Pseudomonas]|uniref:Uncharacterized protein n=1 Tax=Pseudomonas lutea TaxID=243924 RepID=A0A9X8MH74_9PSED|nr:MULTISPECIES: hypothetical protein [Pseudomonas]SER37841.1 hypothetical protein SAMN05216409_118113 [Pseudomonas lutea]
MPQDTEMPAENPDGPLIAAIGTARREPGTERIVIDPIGDPHIKDGMLVYASGRETVSNVLKELERLQSANKYLESRLKESKESTEHAAQLYRDALDRLLKYEPVEPLEDDDDFLAASTSDLVRLGAFDGRNK